MFRSFGHASSSVLNGGLPIWEAEGFPLVSDCSSVMQPASYPTPFYDPSVVKGIIFIKGARSMSDLLM